MKLVATRTTASFAGAWTGLGFIGFHAWTKAYPRDFASEQLWVFLVVLLVFFFTPMFIFVFGTDDGSAPVRRLPQMAVRMLLWLVGASLVLAPGMPLVARLYAS